jgi:tetratricopeptide (TPR) repeat protein
MKNLRLKTTPGKSVVRLLKSCLASYRQRQYATTIRQADEILKVCPLSVPALLAKARAIQLLSEDATMKRYTLDAAKDALLSACEADPHSTEALNELAFYLYAVEDKSREAYEVFEKSITISLANLSEAIAGQSKCLIDTNRMTASEASRAVKKSKALLNKLTCLRKPTCRE